MSDEGQEQHPAHPVSYTHLDVYKRQATAIVIGAARATNARRLRELSIGIDVAPIQPRSPGDSYPVKQEFRLSSLDAMTNLGEIVTN